MIQQKIFKNTKKIYYFQKLFMTELSNLKKENVQTVKISKKKVPAYRKSTPVFTDVKNYLLECKADYLFEYIPKRIMRKNFKGRSSVYLINPAVCKNLCSMIAKDLENSSLVIECNPGLGILTQELLKIVPTIHLYEKGETFRLPKHPLPILIEKFPSRLKLKNLDLFDMWLLLLRDEHFYENMADSYLDEIKKCEWQEKPFAQIIAMCSTRKFLSLMVYNFAIQTRFFENGRPEFYILLPKDIWERCLCIEKSRHYTRFQVFFNLFFNYKYYGEVPRKCALPWPTRSSCSELLNIPFSVLNIQPKIEAFDIIEKDDLKAFWYFLKFSMRSKKLRVIAEFENVIPGSGKEFIKQDIDICTTFKELLPQKLLKLFKEFRKLPEYDINLFKSSAEDAIDEFKKEEDEETDIDVNDEGS